MKGGVRYPFYVNSALLKGRKAEDGSVLRVSAPDLEAMVLLALHQKFTVLDENNGFTPADLVDHTVARVVLDLKHIVITLKSAGENSSEPIEVPWSPRKTRELAQIDEAGSHGHRPPNPRLVQAIVRAHVWLKLLTDGTYDSIEALAVAVGLQPQTHPQLGAAGISLACNEQIDPSRRPARSVDAGRSRRRHCAQLGQAATAVRSNSEMMNRSATLRSQPSIRSHA